MGRSSTDGDKTVPIDFIRGRTMRNLIFTVLIMLAVGCTNAQIDTSAVGDHNMNDMLNSVQISGTSFDRATVKEVFAYLSASNAGQAKNGESITFVFPHEDDLQQIVTMQIQASTLSAAIREVCKSNSLMYRIENNAVYIMGYYDEPGPISIRSYRLPLLILEKWISEMPSPENLIALLGKYRIPFPVARNGVSILYDANTELLTVVNTTDSLNAIGAFLAAMHTEAPP